MGVRMSDISIGSGVDDVNIAVHLDGGVASAYFVNFGLAAQQRAILVDGPAFQRRVSFIWQWLHQQHSYLRNRLGLHEYYRFTRA